MNVGNDDFHKNASRHTGDMIRRDKEQAREIAFQQLKIVLAHAFSAPDGSYKPLSAAATIERNQLKRS